MPFQTDSKRPTGRRERPVKSGTVIHFHESRFRHTSVQTRANFYVIFNGANRVFVRFWHIVLEFGGGRTLQCERIRHEPDEI
jgi:hypothetical protein